VKRRATLRQLEAYGELGDVTLVQMAGRLAFILEGAPYINGFWIVGGKDKEKRQRESNMRAG
jgi:hypothetical protein